MSGVLGYLAARSLRESLPAASGDEGHRPQPSVRPRVPSFYEATEEREFRLSAPILIEEETASSEQAAKPRAAPSLPAAFPAPAHAAVDAAAPHPSSAPSPPPLPLRHDSNADIARTREPTAARSRVDKIRGQRSGDMAPPTTERGASKAASPSRPEALEAPPAVDGPRVAAPPPEQPVPRSRAIIDSAAPENLRAPFAPPPLIVRPRCDADKDRPWQGVEARVPGLVPKIDAPREVLRQPQRLAPAPPAAPRVQVTIGRIEIRAAYAPPRPPPAPRPAPAMSLDDYLANREQGRGGT
jgi:hypothetical protein